MKKEFINPTMRFSFFSRENIVTDSATNVADAENAVKNGAGDSNVSITTMKVSEIKKFTL